MNTANVNTMRTNIKEVLDAINSLYLGNTISLSQKNKLINLVKESLSDKAKIRDLKNELIKISCFASGYDSKIINKLLESLELMED